VPGYTITITPGDDGAARTTIHVDTASGTAQITELTVRAAQAAGLSPNQLPAVDLGALIAALTPTPEPATGTRTSRRRSAAAAPAPASAAARKPTRVKRTAAKSTARLRRAEATPAAEEATSGRRAYRRMPDAKQLLAAYRRAGNSPTRLAENFDVPRHTVNGWIRRLRDQGLLDTQP
jgi:hypothetical protein